MVSNLEEALAAIMAIGDCPATRRLCLDCWVWSQEHGEEAGLSYARMLLEGVKVYQAHKTMIRNWGKSSRVPDSL